MLEILPPPLPSQIYGIFSPKLCALTSCLGILYGCVVQSNDLWNYGVLLIWSFVFLRTLYEIIKPSPVKWGHNYANLILLPRSEIEKKSGSSLERKYTKEKTQMLFLVSYFCDNWHLQNCSISEMEWVSSSSYFGTLMNQLWN